MHTKKILCFVMAIVLFTVSGCSSTKPKEPHKLVWWLDSFSIGTTTFGNPKTKYKDKQVIVTDVTKKFNDLLKKKGFDYTVEFRYMDDRKLGSITKDPTHEYLKRLKDNEPVDLFVNSTNDFSDMAPLDSYIKTSKNMQAYFNMFPSSFRSVNEVDHKTLYIPMTTVSYSYRNALALDNNIAQKNGVDIHSIHDAASLIQAMQKVYDNSQGSVLPISYQNMQGDDFYTNTCYDIPNSPVQYLRFQKQGNKWKIVNLYKTKEFSNFIQMVEYVNKNNLTGLQLSSSDFIEQLAKGAFVTVVPYYSKDIMSPNMNGETLLSFGQPQINSVGGTAIYKNSSHKKAALDLIGRIDTDKELSELCIYGLEGKDYEKKDGLVYTKKNPMEEADRISSKSSIGNFLIITPSSAMGKDGQKYSKEYLQQIPTIGVEGFVPELTASEKQLLVKVSKNIGPNTPFLAKKDAINKLNQQNTIYDQKGIPKIIDKLQKQLDAYLKQGAGK